MCHDKIRCTQEKVLSPLRKSTNCNTSSSSTLADDSCSLFFLSPIPTTKRGCYAPLVKSICLILKQNVAPIQKTHNHHPCRTRKLLGSPISCCGCWLQRPLPCPASSTVPPSTNIHHSCSHIHWCHPQSSNVGNMVQTVGWRKQSILWVTSHWTPSSTPQSWQCNSNDERSSNSCSMTFILLSSSHTSFNPWWPVPVHCPWISSTVSQVGKVPHCQARPIWQ